MKLVEVIRTFDGTSDETFESLRQFVKDMNKVSVDCKVRHNLCTAVNPVNLPYRTHLALWSIVFWCHIFRRRFSCWNGAMLLLVTLTLQWNLEPATQWAPSSWWVRFQVKILKYFTKILIFFFFWHRLRRTGHTQVHPGRMGRPRWSESQDGEIETNRFNGGQRKSGQEDRKRILRLFGQKIISFKVCQYVFFSLSINLLALRLFLNSMNEWWCWWWWVVAKVNQRDSSAPQMCWLINVSPPISIRHSLHHTMASMAYPVSDFFFSPFKVTKF